MFGAPDSVTSAIHLECLEMRRRIEAETVAAIVDFISATDWTAGNEFQESFSGPEIVQRIRVALLRNDWKRGGHG